jgi:hypothetical protein
MIAITFVTLFAVVAGCPAQLAFGQDSAAAEEESLQVVAPIPAETVQKFKLDPFYRQCLMVDELPIVASDQVHAAALQETYHIVRAMLADRKDIIARLAKNNVRITVMGTNERTCDIPEHSDLRPADYWNRRARGLGATHHRPSISCAEENVLNLRGDPYHQECILIHEFAHAIHQMAVVDLDDTFQDRLQKAYEAAIQAEKWKGTYAASNLAEYWAEGVQSWFDCNRSNDSQHNEVDTRDELREYDPPLYELCREVFGDRPWRYVRSDDKSRNESYVRELDRSTMPVFSWESDK